MNKEIKLLKDLEEDMYNINRQISFNYIAINKKPDDKFVNQINRFIGDWIKSIREHRERLENMTEQITKEQISGDKNAK